MAHVSHQNNTRLVTPYQKNATSTGGGALSREPDGVPHFRHVGWVAMRGGRGPTVLSRS